MLGLTVGQLHCNLQPGTEQPCTRGCSPLHRPQPDTYQRPHLEIHAGAPHLQNVPISAMSPAHYYRYTVPPVPVVWAPCLVHMHLLASQTVSADPHSDCCFQCGVCRGAMRMAMSTSAGPACWPPKHTRRLCKGHVLCACPRLWHRSGVDVRW